MRGEREFRPNGLQYLLFREGAHSGKVKQSQRLMFKNDWWLVFDHQDLLDFHSQNSLVFDSCWSLVVHFRSMPSSMFYAFCFHFASTLYPVWIHFASCLLPASYCLLCGWDCFHVLMTDHHMPVSNMFPSTYTNIICCYCFEVCHHLPLPM
jgi:hypothetical protein